MRGAWRHTRQCWHSHAASHRSLREGYAWAEDKEHCEEYGRMLNCDPRKARCQAEQCASRADKRLHLSQVSARAKKRGLPQMGTLGAGNHYAEIQARATRHRILAMCRV